MSYRPHQPLGSSLQRDGALCTEELEETSSHSIRTTVFHSVSPLPGNYPTDLLIPSEMKESTVKNYILPEDDTQLGSLSMGLCNPIVSNFFDPICPSPSAGGDPQEFSTTTGLLPLPLSGKSKQPSSWWSSLMGSASDSFIDVSEMGLSNEISSFVSSSNPVQKPQGLTVEEIHDDFPTTTPSAETGAGTDSQRKPRGNKAPKLCEVCGDKAKSNHFGGVSCDSCKAFFRRAVYADTHTGFRCHFESACVITITTRKQCQACRFKKCLAIGMEMKMVMNDDERLEFLKRRTQKKVDSNKEGGGEGDTVKSLVPLRSASANFFPNSHINYEPKPSEMSQYMLLEDQLEIENMVSKFHQSYVDVPYSASRSSQNRNSIEIIEMFTTILRRMVYFHKMTPDFNSLRPDDQTSLLRQGVLEMCMLRSAFTFDPKAHQWPLGAKKTPMQRSSLLPQLSSMDAKKLVSLDLYQMHIRFIASIQALKVDEKISIIMNHIVLYYPDRIGLKEPARVSFIQEKYLRFLKNYTAWKYGPYGSRMYAKLLGKLSDLRQLNDSHNEYNLRLAQTEITQIQRTLSSINLNPYPEWEVVRCDQTKGIGVVEPIGKRSLSSIFSCGSSTTTLVSNLSLPHDLFREYYHHPEENHSEKKTYVLTAPVNPSVSIPTMDSSQQTLSSFQRLDTYLPNIETSHQPLPLASIPSHPPHLLPSDPLSPVHSLTFSTKQPDLQQHRPHDHPLSSNMNKSDIRKSAPTWDRQNPLPHQLGPLTSPSIQPHLSVHHQHHHHVFLHHGWKPPSTETCTAPTAHFDPADTHAYESATGIDLPSLPQEQFSQDFLHYPPTYGAENLELQQCLPNGYSSGVQDQDLYRLNYLQYQQQNYDPRKDNPLVGIRTETTTTAVASYTRQYIPPTEFNQHTGYSQE